MDVRVFYVDEDNEAAEAFALLKGWSVPHFFFIDKEGHVVNNLLGFSGARELNRYVDTFVEGLE